ncbi:MAG: hypothetical protein ABW048_09450 [Sphingobium sp.]
MRRFGNAILAAALFVPLPASAAPAPRGAAKGDAAIFRAAGLWQRPRGWNTGCDDSGEPMTPAAIEERRDVNGDGRPEAVVVEYSSFCYGMAGQAFFLVSQQADGSWKMVANDVGIPRFLKTKGVAGWPDISIGGPGFCFPVRRWNGREYAINRREYNGKPCR